ncbi:transcriptional regulator, MarR family [delta proteobacterium NaphS2]|nr:transcriptional regulator, MarR family [delta proteobacterium NaphS2]
MSQQNDDFDLARKEELDRRSNSFKVMMAEQDINFAIIMQNADIFYFTGAIQKGWLVIARDSDPLFFIEKSIATGTDIPFEVIYIKSDRDLKKILKNKKILAGKGGLELEVVPVTVFERFKEMLGYDDFVNISPLIRELKALKSPYEMEQTQKTESIAIPSPVGYLIARAYLKMREVIHKEMIPLGLTHAQFVVIVHLANFPHTTHTGFCRLLDYNPGAMTRLLGRIEKKGFIRRVRDSKDRRSLRLELTDKGLEIYPCIVPRLGKAYNQLLRGFSKTEAMMFEQYLRMISASGSSR